MWTGVSSSSVYEGKLMTRLRRYSDKFIGSTCRTYRAYFNFCDLGTERAIIIATQRPYNHNRVNNVRVYVVGSSPELNQQTLDVLFRATKLPQREPDTLSRESLPDIIRLFERTSFQFDPTRQ